MNVADKGKAVMADASVEVRHAEALLKTDALQRAIVDSATFSSIATDADGVIQIFNVGAERMLGFTADEVVTRVTPAQISDPLEVVARATALSVELGETTPPGFEALVFKASRGIEDIYELTYVRKDGTHGAAAVIQKPISRDDLQDLLGGLGLGLLPPPHGKTLKVLIVDDDPKAVELIAVRMVMPNVSGFDVVEALHADAATARIPILVVTGFQVSGDERAKLQGHVVAIMEKGRFGHDRFSSEVKRAMSGREVGA